MKIEVISIGNEVLSGYTINTNASFISQALLKQGLLLSRHTVVSDEFDAILKAFEERFQFCEVIIATGGLGPTLDDQTRQAAARYFDCDFTFRKEVAQTLQKRYPSSSISLLDQATLPSKAILIDNPNGTACGLIFQNLGRHLILLPGVPLELKGMFDDVLAYILSIYRGNYSAVKELHLFGLAESEVDPVLRTLQENYPALNIGIYASSGLLTIRLIESLSSIEKPAQYLSLAYTQLVEKLSSYMYHSLSGKIEEAVHQRFIERKWTLSVAESCTGGYLSSRLTRLAGASAYFQGGIVSYANEVKSKVLKVPKELIETKGAVSAEVVQKMAEGALALTGTDFSLADSGVAGPGGGTLEKPVGLVYGAIAKKGAETIVWKMNLHGSREMIIERATNLLLAKLLREAN